MLNNVISSYWPFWCSITPQISYPTLIYHIIFFAYALSIDRPTMVFGSTSFWGLSKPEFHILSQFQSLGTVFMLNGFSMGIPANLNTIVLNGAKIINQVLRAHRYTCKSSLSIAKISLMWVFDNLQSICKYSNNLFNFFIILRIIFSEGQLNGLEYVSDMIQRICPTYTG